MQQLHTSLSGVLLVIVPWSLPLSFIEVLSASFPNLKVIEHKCNMYDTAVPAEISQQVWSTVTALFTWNCVPTKAQATNLKLVQLLSAGCNQVMGNPLFEDTDIAFCTANGVHP